MSLGISFGCGVVLARVLNPEDFGTVALASAFVLIINRLTGIGIGEEIVRLDRDRESFRECIGTYILLNSLLVISAFLLSCVLLFISGILEGRARTVFLVIAGGWGISGFGAPFQALLQRQMRFRAVAALNWFSTSAGALGGVAMAVFGFGIWSLVIPQMFALSLATVIAAILTGFAPRLCWRRDVVANQLRKAPWYLGVGLAEESYQRIDDIAVAKLLGVQPLGFYRRAYNLGGLFHHSLGTVLTRVMYPFFARQSADRELLSRAHDCVTRLAIYAVWSAVCLVGIFCREVVGGLYGEKWLPCVPIFWAMAPYAIALPLFETNKGLLIALGHVHDTGKTYASMLLLLVVALVPGLVWGGASGAAVAVDLTLILGLWETGRRVAKLMPLHALLTYIRPLLVCLTGTALLLACRYTLSARPLPIQLTAVAAVWALFAGTVALTVERSLLTALMFQFRRSGQEPAAVGEENDR